MLSTLYGQSRVKQQLSLALQSNSLPQSILFYGDAYRGKRTASFEVARTLCCLSEHKSSDCSCRSCSDFKRMTSPNLLLLGQRPFLEEMKALGALYLERRDDSSLLLVIRLIRQVLKRFDGALWEGTEKKISKYTSSISGLNELVELLDSGGAPQDKRGQKKAIKTATDYIKTLSAGIPKTIPVDQIRNISRWAHYTSGGSHKIVIIEGAHSLTESSSNSLLKILEEPPKNLSFILITENKGAMLETILSRVRSFEFLYRDKIIDQKILKEIFFIDLEQSKSLKDFFQEYSDIDYNFLKKEAENFIEEVQRQSLILDLEDLFSFFEKNKDKKVYYNFLTILLDQYRSSFLTGGLKLDRHELHAYLQVVIAKINESKRNCEIYNQGSLTLLEGLFFTLRESYETFNRKND